MGVTTIDGLFSYREKVDRFIDKRKKDRDSLAEEYQRKWEKVAPELLDICSCIFPNSTVKAKFGYEKALEIKITSKPHGCFLSLQEYFGLSITEDSIQFVENTPLYKNRQTIVWLDSEKSKVADFYPILERNVNMMEYILDKWDEVKPAMIEAVANSLRAWGEEYQ